MAERIELLVLIGSPTGDKGLSSRLGSYIRDRVVFSGGKVRIKSASLLVDSASGLAELMDSIRKSRVIIFVSPVYIDSPSYYMTKAMEEIRRFFKPEELSEKRLVVLSYCGFPEVEHNRASVSIYKVFAAAAGMKWSGGLMLGGTYGMIVWKLPALVNIIAGNVKKSLDMMVDSLLAGQQIPAEAFSLISRKMLPKRIALLLARSWLLTNAKINKSTKTLYRKPYIQSEV